MSSTNQSSEEPKDKRDCLGWCNKKFKPKGKEHFCEECNKKRRKLGHQLETHGQQSRSFGSSPSL